MAIFKTNQSQIVLASNDNFAGISLMIAGRGGYIDELVEENSYTYEILHFAANRQEPQLCARQTSSSARRLGQTGRSAAHMEGV